MSSSRWIGLQIFILTDFIMALLFLWAAWASLPAWIVITILLFSELHFLIQIFLEYTLIRYIEQYLLHFILTLLNSDDEFWSSGVILSWVSASHNSGVYFNLALRPRYIALFLSSLIISILFDMSIMDLYLIYFSGFMDIMYHFCII